MFFSDENIINLAPPFKFALVAEFSHGRPSMSKIKSGLDSFGLKAGFLVGLQDGKHILMRFNSEDDYHRIWLREQ